MMHNTYSCTSSIISSRTFFAFNDCSNYSNERCPSTYCSYCCSFPVNSSRLILPMNINPSYLCGLRQSTLIQWPHSRRVVLGSSDRYCIRSSSYDVGRCCCGESCCVNQERVGRVLGRRCQEKCCVNEKKSIGGSRVLGRSCTEHKIIDVNKVRARMTRRERDFRCNALGDAEAMLSLLAENCMEECVAVRERKRSSCKEAKVVRGKSVGIEKCKDRKENVGTGYLESETNKQQVESGNFHSREEGHRRKEKREGMLVDEDQRLRRRESSSSYYSLSDSGDFESDTELETKQESIAGELSTSQVNDSWQSAGVVNSEETKQDSKTYKDAGEQQLITSVHEHVRGGRSTKWDWRKKSEKKLTEESAEISHARKDSVVRQSKFSQANESSSMMASSSKKQFDHQKQESTSDVRSHRQFGSHIKTDNGVSKYLKSSAQSEHATSDVSFHGQARSHIITENKLSEYSKSSHQHKQSTANVSVHGKSESRIKRDNQTSEYLKSSDHHEQTTQSNRHNIETASTTWRRSIQGEEAATAVGQSVRETGCEYCRECGRSMQETNTQSDKQWHAEHSETHDDSRSTTTVQSLSESRHRKQEVGLSSVQTSTEEENKQRDQLYLAAGQVEARKKSRQFREAMDTDSSYVTSTVRAKQQSEMPLKSLGESSTSVNSFQEVERLQDTSGGKVIEETESLKLSQIGTSASALHSMNMEINSHFASDKRIYSEENYSTTKVKSVEELVEKRKQIEETILQSRLRTEVQEPILQAGASGSFSGEANAFQPSAALVSQTGVQQVSKGEIMSDSQLLMMSPSHQSIGRRSPDGKPSSSSARNESAEIAEVDTVNAFINPQARTPSSSNEIHYSGSKSFEESSPEDALGSAECMQESTTQIVGEFVEKMRHEASTSETRVEKKLSQLDSRLQDKKDTPEGYTQSDSEKGRLLKQDSSHSSGGLGTKGPSDEMWDVKDHFVQEASELESLEGTTSESVVARRTGKSLWNIVGGIFRLRWGSSSETRKSPVKASRQSSPNKSGSGETWFSGNEQEEASGPSIKTELISMPQEPMSTDQPLPKRTSTRIRKEDCRESEQTSIPQEPTSSDQPLLRRTTTRSQKDEIRVISSDDRLSQLEVDGSASSIVLQGGSVSEGVSIGAQTDLFITPQTSLSSPLDLSVPSFRQLRRSHACEEIEEPSKYEGLTSSSGEQGEQSIDARRSSVSASEETDAELNRRKLRRSKQVLQERYDDWEDAYRRETEQRKVDEIFMREALAEAIKAADSWEVPIGAVLVQNGKIIARGYNLVEELRDSTAHAEMICIREASNALRTWRLSETTLYVTLEPCPMCAGAILQARIGTLVWGAPNKLLGADGSWIRLFPGGEEGQQRSEAADKPAAPVHPFHPKMNIRRGILEAECAQIMQQFFQLRRKEKEKDKKSEEPDQPSRLRVPHHPSKLLHKMHNIFHITFCL